MKNKILLEEENLEGQEGVAVDLDNSEKEIAADLEAGAAEEGKELVDGAANEIASDLKDAAAITNAQTAIVFDPEDFIVETDNELTRQLSASLRGALSDIEDNTKCD